MTLTKLHLAPRLRMIGPTLPFPSTPSWRAQEHLYFYFIKGKGKFHPITDHEGPEVEYRYCSTLSLTSVVGGGG